MTKSIIIKGASKEINDHINANYRKSTKKKGNNMCADCGEHRKTVCYLESLKTGHIYCKKCAVIMAEEILESGVSTAAKKAVEVNEADMIKTESEIDNADLESVPEGHEGKAGDTVEQLGYKGETEVLSAEEYCNRIDCECGDVRWVKVQDVFQVTMCKPCTAQARKDRRNARIRTKRAAARAAKEAAASA